MVPTSWNFYLSSEEAWAAMFRDFELAKRTIDIEEYIFLNDEAGRPMYDLLMRKAKEGVKIRMHLDSAGSFMPTHSPAFLGVLRAAGIEVQVFNPILPGHLPNALSWHFRDHRKVVVIDKEIAHTGGVCMQESMRKWRDTQVRVTGEIVQQFSRAFERMWENGVKGKYIWIPKEKPTLDGFQVLTNAPRFHQRYVYHDLLLRIRKAASRIYITTPYFIPNYRFFRALRSAIRRKVDVRILLVDRSDHTFVDHASDFHVDAILRNGGRVYRYSPSMIHAKSAIIDDWATVGSTNIDNLSLLLNHELNLASTHKSFVHDVLKIFEEDIGNSKELDLVSWRNRPWSNKLIEILTWPLHRVL